MLISVVILCNNFLKIVLVSVMLGKQRYPTSRPQRTVVDSNFMDNAKEAIESCIRKYFLGR